MNEQPNTSRQEDGPPTDPSIEKSRAAWTRWGQRIRRITPNLLVRAALIVALLLLVGWLISQAWVALIPFVFGGAVAYALLPLVNWLDRFLPRFLAALVALTPVILIGALCLSARANSNSPIHFTDVEFADRTGSSNFNRAGTRLCGNIAAKRAGGNLQRDSASADDSRNAQW